ncbi:conserved hypothetical protein [Paecilomyces variotii No. 5]|uniref:Major facilitator superfamily (MFS) profile domain-containing protein n=1 Tax=Byssochlamys spectabilis (strain No. 5 / NBRC 109023) TaxID=1356009 RepID=V5G7A1_BYSSN|nr:conserved hypothetical protein [Paecilomyces variotii No. 5]
MVAEGTYASKEAGSGNDDVIAVNIAESTQPDWDEKEERRVKLKIDLILLPILGLAFFALQCDRGNIANALTDTITKDLKVTTNQINVGNSLLSAGIVILEIPSNILLQKVGPQRWLSFQIISWGLVATFQAFATNYAGYLVTRILLGLCEAGFIPGALYTMSTWYKKSETSLRISLFFLGNLLASATVSLIGAGILTMAGRDGVAVEGIITIGIGIIFILLLPPRVGNPKPLIGFGRWSYFTPREQYILVRRVLLDDPAKTTSELSITGRDVWKTVRDPRILVHVLITLSSTISVQAVQTYAPSIIKSLGFTSVKANALFSVGNFIAAAMAVILGFLADRIRRRGPSALIGSVWCLVSYACLRESIHFPKWNRYAAIVFAVATNSMVQSPQQRSVAMALIIMAANAAGIAGNQVFRTQDAPLYLNAFTAMLCLAAVCLATVIVQTFWYIWSNRQMAKSGNVPTIQAKTEGTEIVRTWWWTW